MLVDFSVTNRGPFRDRATLSMLTASCRENPENAVEVAGFNGKLLTSAAVFGPNASGKSALFGAFRSLQDIVSGKGLSSAYDPFGHAGGTPTEMEVRLVLGGIRYRYVIAYTADSVVREELHHSPNGRTRRVFVKTGEKSPHLAESDAPACSAVREAILGARVVGPDTGPCPESGCVEFAGRILDALGVDPSDPVSNGGRELVRLSGWMADALIDGRTLFVDGFGEGIHPVLTRWLLDLFSAGHNVNLAQLVFSTHDLSLMTWDGPLRRDQMYLVNPMRDGASELYSVSDFKGVTLRTNVLAEYLFGRYDAIPWTRSRPWPPRESDEGHS